MFNIYWSEMCWIWITSYSFIFYAYIRVELTLLMCLLSVFCSYEHCCLTCNVESDTFSATTCWNFSNFSICTCIVPSVVYNRDSVTYCHWLQIVFKSGHLFNTHLVNNNDATRIWNTQNQIQHNMSFNFNTTANTTKSTK